MTSIRNGRCSGEYLYYCGGSCDNYITVEAVMMSILPYDGGSCDEYINKEAVVMIILLCRQL
jgi:hypothetical protein